MYGANTGAEKVAFSLTYGYSYFRHLITNLCALACGYAAVCVLRALWSAYGATQAACGVR